jgi:glycosyltransferase involved in cell wall biosynthesis
MRVLLDGAAFQNAHQRGIQRYFVELLARLPGDAEVRLALSGAPRSSLPRGVTVKRIDGHIGALVPRKMRPGFRSILCAPALRLLARSSDLFHSTYYTPAPSARIPSVLTVYDMIVERFVDYFSSSAIDREVEQKRIAIESADALIAISEATARELVAFYPRCAGRTVVVHPGHEHVLAPAAPNPLPTELVPPETRFALFVGDRAAYKNFRVILEAAASSLWPRDLKVVVVGSKWRPNEQLMIDRLGLASRVVLVGRVSNDALASLYRASTAVIVPSLAEGFGFPVIEAQAASAMLICSDIDVFREIAGSGGLFFDPHRPDELASKLAEAIDLGAAHSIRDAARLNLTRFTWQACADQTWQVYQRTAPLGDRP